MRLVDGEEGDRGAIEQAEHALLHEALGGDVKQVQPAGRELALDGVLPAAVLGRVEEGGAHARLLQGVDLILHERNQRRDDEPGAGADEGWNLIAEGLAAAGRHQGEHVAAGDQRLDDVGLMRAEARVAEHLLQHVLGLGEARRGSEGQQGGGFPQGGRWHEGPSADLRDRAGTLADFSDANAILVVD